MKDVPPALGWGGGHGAGVGSSAYMGPHRSHSALAKSGVPAPALQGMIRCARAHHFPLGTEIKDVAQTVHSLTA